MKKGKPVIEVKNLVKRYKKSEKNAVDGINFEVREGEFFAFLGPNGAGKTTTISVLTTTLAKTSGEVKISGVEIDDNPQKVRGEIGVIFQNPSLDLNLTAEENLRFHALLYNLYPFAPTYSLMAEEYKRRVKELAEVLGLEERIFDTVRSYSGGMKRKLEIIRSLMHHPKILFLDEPTSGLDPESRKSLWNYLEGVMKKRKTTMFLTTHYLEEAESADRVAIINQGKIVALGTPEEIKKKLIEEYLVIDAEDRDGLINELRGKKWKYEEEKRVKVKLNGMKSAEVIQKIKTPLNFLEIHQPTLEEAYLEVIGSNNGESG